MIIRHVLVCLSRWWQPYASCCWYNLSIYANPFYTLHKISGLTLGTEKSTMHDQMWQS